MLARKIIWSADAIADYHQNIDYLLIEWSETVASNFIEDVEGALELIANYPEMYPLANYRHTEDSDWKADHIVLQRRE